MVYESGEDFFATELTDGIKILDNAEELVLENISMDKDDTTEEVISPLLFHIIIKHIMLGI